MYAAVIALGDSRVWSGSDAGGKAATVRHMDATGSWVPEVGYWAEDLDPDGRHHPLVNTASVDGRWYQATGLLLPMGGRVLYGAFGFAGLLVMPALGSALAAWAAGRLALSWGARSSWPAFWAVGLGTPMLFYAADFWEHSIAVGFAMAALSVVVRTGTGANHSEAVVAGALMGLAAALRTEMLVFAVAVGAAMLVTRRSSVRTALVAGATAAVVLGANLVLETLYLPHSGATRAGGHVSGAGAEVAGRARDAAVTTIGLFADDSAAALAVGAAAAIGLLALGATAASPGALRPEPPNARGSGRKAPEGEVGVGVGRAVSGVVGRALAAVAVGLFLFRALRPFGFIPGALLAAPLAAAGVWARPRAASPVAAGVVLALPLVWVFAWQGNLVAQWGGRLVLLTGTVLTVAGVVAIEEGGWRRGAVAGISIVTVIVGGVVAAWHIERTNGYAGAIAEISSVPADTVVISRLAHLGREAGGWWGEHRWLSAASETDLRSAAAVAARAGADRIDVVDSAGTNRGSDGPPRLAGWRLVGTRKVDLLGSPLAVHTYHRTNLRQ